MQKIVHANRENAENFNEKALKSMCAMIFENFKRVWSAKSLRNLATKKLNFLQLQKWAKLYR